MLLLSALWLSSHPAPAQIRLKPTASKPTAKAKAGAATTMKLLAGIPLKCIGYSALPGAGWQLVLTVAPATGRPAMTPLQVQVLDSALRLVSQRTVQLRGKCTLLDTSPLKSKQVTAFQFRQHNPGADSVLLLAFDAAGQPTGVQATRRHLTGRNRTAPLNLPTPDLVVKSAGSTRRDFTVQSLLPTLRPCWEQHFTAPKGAARLNAYAADSTHIWLLLTEHANSRRNTPVAVCLDAATGRQLSRTPLSTGPGLREASTCTMGPGHSLTIVGHAFAGPRPKNARMGELFVLRLRPDGRVAADQQVALAPLPRHHKVIWQQVQEAPTGGLHIIGETYTKTSAGVVAAVYAVTCVATLNYCAVTQTVLRPRNLLLLDLDASGKLTQAQIMDLPKGGSFYEGRYRAARRMARLAAEKGKFRYRATAPGSVTLLHTKKQLLEVKPGSKVPLVLRTQPEDCTQEIVGTSGHQVLVTNFNKKKKQFSLLRLPY